MLKKHGIIINFFKQRIKELAGLHNESLQVEIKTINQLSHPQHCHIDKQRDQHTQVNCNFPLWLTNLSGGCQLIFWYD